MPGHFEARSHLKLPYPTSKTKKLFTPLPGHFEARPHLKLPYPVVAEVQLLQCGTVLQPQHALQPVALDGELAQAAQRLQALNLRRGGRRRENMIGP